MKTWRSTWGTWRTSARDERFVRDRDGVWRYGADGVELAGMPVAAAIDFVLEELISPVLGETQRRAPQTPWDDGLPYGMRADGLYLSLNEVRRLPELRELQDGPAVRDWSSRAVWVHVGGQDWARLRGRVIGLRAPELATSGYARPLAQAERDVRIARRQRALASEGRRRAARILAARGATCGQLARALGISRERAHQLVHASPNADTDVAAPPSHAVTLAMLRAADERWRRRCAELTATQAVRRQRVLLANERFQMGLGEIADILDTTRSQAQQLRDSAR